MDHTAGTGMAQNNYDGDDEKNGNEDKESESMKGLSPRGQALLKKLLRLRTATVDDDGNAVLLSSPFQFLAHWQKHDFKEHFCLDDMLNCISSLTETAPAFTFSIDSVSPVSTLYFLLLTPIDWYTLVEEKHHLQLHNMISSAKYTFQQLFDIVQSPSVIDESESWHVEEWVINALFVFLFLRSIILNPSTSKDQIQRLYWLFQLIPKQQHLWAHRSPKVPLMREPPFWEMFEHQNPAASIHEYLQEQTYGLIYYLKQRMRSLKLPWHTNILDNPPSPFSTSPLKLHSQGHDQRCYPCNCCFLDLVGCPSHLQDNPIIPVRYTSEGRAVRPTPRFISNAELEKGVHFPVHMTVCVYVQYPECGAYSRFSRSADGFIKTCVGKHQIESILSNADTLFQTWDEPKHLTIHTFLLGLNNLK